MEQTLQQRLQSKAHEMVACLEFIKLNIKSDSKEGRVANGINKLSKRYMLFNRAIRLSVISSFFILIIYTLYNG